MAHHTLVAGLLLLLSLHSLSLYAAAPIPQAAINALQAGKLIDLIVEFDSTEIDNAAKALRRPADIRDAPAISSFRSQRYRETKDKLEAALAAHPVETRIDYSHLPMRLKRFRSLAALQAWSSNPQVRAIHLDGELFRVLPYSLPLVEEPPVATTGYTGTGTTVAVIDDGINYGHATFGNCTAPGAPASCRVVQSILVGSATGGTDNNHGTNVSAIVLGVAPGTKIAMLNPFSGNSASISNVLTGINWAISNRATYNIVAINMSLGDGSQNTSPCNSSFSNPFVTPVANATNAGITVVAAAGNEAYTNALASPACAAKVVSVGAVYSANWGGLSWGGSHPCTDSTSAADKVTCFSNSASFLTMLAPGARITAAGIQFGGTSQASPHVAGAVAVLRSAFPAESLTATLNRLTTTGISVTDPRNGLIKPRLDLLPAARPANDNYSARITLSGTSGSATGTNLLATQEAGEVALAAGASGRTVWWKWTAPSNGQVALDTHGSAFDTALTVYQNGPGVAGLVPIVSNDNDGTIGGASGLLFQVSAGNEYEIAVDGMNAAQGAVALNWALNTSAAANLSINLSGPPTGNVGVNTDYTLSAANAGPQTATNATVTIALPAGANYVSSSLPCVPGAGNLVCALGTLNSGANTALTITLYWTTEGNQLLSASIASDLNDPFAANNSATLAVNEFGATGDGDVPTLPQWASIFLGMVLLGIGVARQQRLGYAARG